MNDEKYLEFSLVSERFAMDKCGFCGHEDYNLIRNKKFAELIVQECISSIYQTFNTGMSEELGDIAVENIKQHFGVK